MLGFSWSVIDSGSLWKLIAEAAIMVSSYVNRLYRMMSKCNANFLVPPDKSSVSYITLPY